MVSVFFMVSRLPRFSTVITRRIEISGRLNVLAKNKKCFKVKTKARTGPRSAARF